MVTQATDLPREQQQRYCEHVAGLAWANNQTLVVVGETAPDNDHAQLLVCSDVDCCVLRPGVLVVVVDIDTVQLGGVPDGVVMHVARSDGRTAHVMRGGA